MKPRWSRRRVLVCAGLAVLLAGAGAALAGCSWVRGLRCRRRIKSGLRREARLEPAHLDVYGRIPVLHLFGTPEEMGTQHGKLLRRSLTALQGYLGAFTSKEEKERFLAYARAHEKNLPEAVRVELKAVARASGADYMGLVAMNVTPRLGCSALAVWGEAAADGRLLLGRNADYFSMGLADRGHLAIVFHPKEGLPVLSINHLGMVGAFTGVNSAGVCFGNLLVFNARDDSLREDGLAIQLALREAAHRSGDAKAFVAHLKRHKPVIPMNVVVADRRGALVVELSHAGARVRRGADKTLAVTNYFLSPDIAGREVDCPRFAALTRLARERRGRFGVADMKEALHAAHMKGLNLQAVVFEPEAGKIHFSINRMPASAGPYRTFDLKKLFDDAPGAAAPLPEGKGPGKK